MWDIFQYQLCQGSKCNLFTMIHMMAFFQYCQTIVDCMSSCKSGTFKSNSGKQSICLNDLFHCRSTYTSLQLSRFLPSGYQSTLHALADPTRREILNLLKQSRLSAGEISNHFSISGAAISRHLSVLKDADLIRNEREGKFIYYELNTTVLEEILLWINELKGEKNYDQTK